MFVLSDAPAGSTVMIWVNQAGQPADSPLQSSQVTGRVVMARVFAVAALAVVLIIAGWAARWSLDRHRLAAWGGGVAGERAPVEPPALRPLLRVTEVPRYW